MDEFKEFINYAILGFEQMKEENKADYSQMNAKKLEGTIWLMEYMYSKDKAKEKAEKILNNLELVQ